MPRRRSPRPKPFIYTIEDGYHWCPRCVYRIAVDFPNGTTDALAAHREAHRKPYVPPCLATMQALSWSIKEV